MSSLDISNIFHTFSVLKDNNFKELLDFIPDILSLFFKNVVVLLKH